VNDNMKLWKQFETTDPAHTKKVEFGRKFTAIDAHWQIMRVTEVLGPVGHGWGYDVQHSVEKLADNMILAVADVMLWTKCDPAGKYDSSKANYGPVRGTCEFYTPNKSGKMQLDEDAPKKAMTDALTKGLSHLGVSADVFLGLFDDNRYVQKAGAKWEAIKAENDPGIPESVRIVIDLIEKAADREALGKVLDNAREGAAAWTKPQKDLVALKAQEKRAKLGAIATAAE
jgi:hypothetical protein